MYSAFVRHVLDPLDLWRTGDLAVLTYARDFERSQWLPREEIEERRWQAASRLLENAYRNCPFYRRKYDAAGLVPSDIRSFADWPALPRVEKADIQSCRDEMVSTNWPRSDLVANQTGGSTGQPISFYLCRDRLWSRAAATRRHNAWSGWRAGDKYALLWGAAPDAPDMSWKSRLRVRLLNRSLYLDTARITEAALKSFLAALFRFRPSIVQAYARSLVLFARYLDANGLSAPELRAIVTSAETISDEERALVERVFGCPVFNRYGCREFSVIASECDAHDGMHVMAEGLHVEVAHSDSVATGDSKPGALVVTDLLNHAMPMIRYSIGDVAQTVSGDCRCGRKLPRIGELAGRVTDFLVGDDGRLVSGCFLSLYVIANLPWLGQIQLIQDAPRHVVCRVCPPSRMVSKGDALFLNDEMQRHLGVGLQVDIEVVDEIPVGPSGKFLYCRSNVACDFVDVNSIAASPIASSHPTA